MATALTLFVAASDAQSPSDGGLAPAPTLLYPWLEQPEPGLSPRAVGRSVDGQNRSAVASLFHTVYTPSLAIPPGWTGSTAGCVAGATSQAYLDATIAMINYYRAMAGLPSITNDASRNDEAQAAALMMRAQGSLSHNPPPSWACYSAAGAAGAASSNLSLGTTGPGAILAYVRDSGFYNTPVGHRRWILHPPRLQMAPGSTDASNALWVFSASGTRPAAPTIVAWPPPGYVPHTVVYARWSMSLNSAPYADYSNASVTVTENGSAVPVTVLSRTDNGYGDNTIVWQPSLSFSGGQVDRTLSVTVSGIQGAPQSSVTYHVTVFDPATVSPILFTDGFESATTASWSTVVP